MNPTDDVTNQIPIELPRLHMVMDAAIKDLQSAKAAGDIARWLRYCNIIIALDQHNIAVHIERAQAKYALGDFAGALADVDYAIELVEEDSALPQTASETGDETSPSNAAAYAWRDYIRLSMPDPDAPAISLNPDA